MRSARKVRASTDQQQVQEDQPPVTQSPVFIFWMTFLGVIIAIIISVLIYNFFTFPMSYSKPLDLRPRGEQAGQVYDMLNNGGYEIIDIGEEVSR